MAPPRAGADDRPVLFVTTEVPPDRVGAFRALHARTPIELALFGGGDGTLHATAGVEDPGVPFQHVSQRAVFGLAASGRYRAVVAGTVGRTALPAAWLGAERARVPFVLWTALWAHPRSLAHAPGSLLLRLLYRRAAVVVTYGPHVSAFATAHGARRLVVAPQAVDGPLWATARAGGPEAEPVLAEGGAPVPPRLLFVGRDAPGKGLGWLLRAWAASGLGERGEATLRLVGPAADRFTRDEGVAGSAGGSLPAGVTALGPLPPEAVRAELAAAMAVVVPSERTATFREPWGLVVNEAMHAGALVIASDEVGAVAGGLAVDGRTALVAPSGDVNALAASMRRAVVLGSPQLQAIRADAAAAASSYTQEAWASAFAAALDRSVA